MADTFIRDDPNICLDEPITIDNLDYMIDDLVITIDPCDILPVAYRFERSWTGPFIQDAA